MSGSAEVWHSVVALALDCVWECEPVAVAMDVADAFRAAGFAAQVGAPQQSGLCAFVNQFLLIRMQQLCSNSGRNSAVRI